MIGERPESCLRCGGSGVVSFLTHLNIEDRRFCPECKAGWEMIEKIERIVAQAREDQSGGMAASFAGWRGNVSGL